MDHCHDSHSCSGHLSNPSVHQSLDELDFSRGIWQAAVDGEAGEVERFLSTGRHTADQTDSSGYTPMHYASRNGHTDVCSLLIHHGAGVNIKTRSGQATALHRAAYLGHLVVVELLLRHGGDPNLADSDGMLPLHKACERGHQSVAKALLKASPASRQHRDKHSRLPVDCVPKTCPHLILLLQGETRTETQSGDG